MCHRHRLVHDRTFSLPSIGLTKQLQSPQTTPSGSIPRQLQLCVPVVDVVFHHHPRQMPLKPIGRSRYSGQVHGIEREIGPLPHHQHRPPA
jgi:hypothetical protein